MGIAKVFLDQYDIIVAVHDEEQGIADTAYDMEGREVRIIYVDYAAIPTQEVRDGMLRPWKVPEGWYDDNNDAVPVSITGTQGKLTLHEMGKLADAEAVIDGLPTDQAVAARIKWNANTWYRSDPLFNELGGAIGLTPQQIDAAFIAARDAG